MSYRFSNPTQKEVQLKTLTDLMVENQGDQLAKTVLSNAISVLQSTLVTGELDEMIRQSSRMQWWSTIGISVFFGILAAFQLVLGYYVSWGNYISAAATLTYTACLWALYRLQQRYYTHLKWMEDLQLELPTVPLSLHKVN